MSSSKPVPTRQFAATLGSAQERLKRFSQAWLPVGLDLLFPPECAHCQLPLEPGTGARLCETCVASFTARLPACTRCGCVLHQEESTDNCRRCAEQKWHFEGVTRLGAYEARLRSAVLRIKQPHERALATALGDLLAEKVANLNSPWDAVLPVPMHWSRRIWRGANSPETITGRVADRLRIPAAGHLLVRRRRTAPQASLSPAGRRKNVRGAFAVRPHPDLDGARLLLIDDIMTTGATLNEATRCLVKAGAHSVHVAVVARAEGLP